MGDLLRRYWTPVVLSSELTPGGRVKRVKLLWETDQYEASQLYMFRSGFCSNFTAMQPWQLNGLSHGTMYFASLNGPTWMTMIDTNHPSYKR